MEANCGYSLYWHGMYRGTYDLIAPDSFAHPAKMSPTLCYKILEHLEELGLLKEGDTVLDPMAGTGMTNICAGAMGYKSVSVELEEKFVGFQQQNKEYAERRLYKPLDWRMIKGDSRRLGELLQGEGLVSVTSPPYVERHSYADEEREQALVDKLKQHPKSKIGGRRIHTHENAGNPANIGNLKDTPLKSITSPPFAGQNQRDIAVEGYGSQVIGGLKRNIRQTQPYSDNEGQIGNLKDTPLKAITSPPYGDAMSAEKTGIDFTKCGGGRDRTKEPAYNAEVNNPTSVLRYSENPANLGNLPDKPLKSVMSPPYDGDPGHHGNDGGGIRAEKGLRGDYGKSEGQIGDTHSESYLSAMLQVYREIARVSDVLVIVVKNPTRNGKLRRLDLDTIKIMEMAGWEIHCQHRALLFEELKQADLFGDTKKQVKGRLSFFKRLSWQNGQPVASWEDVIIGVSP